MSQEGRGAVRGDALLLEELRVSAVVRLARQISRAFQADLQVSQIQIQLLPLEPVVTQTLLYV